MRNITKTILLFLLLAIIPSTVLADYKGDGVIDTDGRDYRVWVQKTCEKTEKVQCGTECTWWSSESCGSYEWDIGCCMAYGPKYCEETTTYDCSGYQGAYRGDPTVKVSSVCSAGFGVDNWCKDSISVTVTGKEPWSAHSITSVKSDSGQEIDGSSGTFTYSDETNTTDKYWAVSSFGDTSLKSGDVAIKIDHTAPVQNVDISGTLANGWYRGGVVITSIGTDEFGEVSKQYVNIGNGSVENTATVAATFTGTVTPKTRTVDKAGNDSGWKTWPKINVDNTLPLIDSATDPAGAWFRESVHFEVKASDAHSGVDYVEILVDGNVVHTENGSSASIDFSDMADGLHTVSYYAVDKAGNRSVMSGPYTFNFDNTPPVITEATDYNGKWQNHEFSFTLNGTDNLSGVDHGEMWIDGNLLSSGALPLSFTWLPDYEGNHKITYYIYDMVGNQSEPAGPFDFNYDVTVPLPDVTLSGENSNGWYRGSVTVTNSGTDPIGVIAAEYVDLGLGNGSKPNVDTTDASYSGSVTPKARVIDMAGNDSGWVTMPTFNVDNEKPVATKGTDHQGKWFNTVVPLSIAGTDAHSGVAYGEIIADGEVIYSVEGASGTTSYMPEEGVHTVKYAVVDKVGYRSDEIGPYEFGYDITEPTLTLDSNQSFDIVGPVITISGSISDELSGVSRVEIKYGYNGTWQPVTGQPTTGEKTGTWSHTMSSGIAEGKGNFYVRAYDVAGNLNQNNVTFTLRSDHTAPSAGIIIDGEKGEGGVYTGVVTFTADCTDEMAGVREQYVDLNLGDGEKLNSTTSDAAFSGIITPSVRAVDNVGNDSGAMTTDPVMIDNELPYWVDYALPEEGKVYADGFTLSVKGADDLGGMYSATIVVDDVEYPTMGDAAEYQLGDGTHTFAYIITDNAGNKRDSRTDPEFAGKNMSISVDTTVPELEITGPEDGIFVSGTVDVTGKATDNMGVNEIQANPDNNGYETAASGGFGTTELPFTYTVDTTGMEDGTAEILVKAIDAAGNESEPKSVTITVDNTAPTCHIEVEGERGEGGSFRGSVTLKSVCEDNGSGVKNTWIDAGDGEVEGQVTLPEDYTGNTKPIISGEDNVGNNTGPIDDAPIYYNGELLDNFVIDNNPPVVTDFFMPSTKWMRLTEDLNLYVEGEDAEGPILTGTFVINGAEYSAKAIDDHTDLGFPFPEGISSLMYYVTDGAGNNSEMIGLAAGKTSR